MVDIDLSIIFAGLSIAASIVYYASVLRNANKAQAHATETRNVQIFMQFVDKIHNPDLLSKYVRMLRWEWKDLEDFERKYGSVDHPDLYGERVSFFWLLNDLGWLVEKGIVEVEDVNTLVGPLLIWTWAKFEDIILEQRRVYNHPDQYLYWERLYNSLLEYRRKETKSIEIPEFFDDYLSSIKEES
jgi:hypothetical protein